MNDIEKWFNNHQGRRIIKQSNYLNIYEKFFSRFKGLKPSVLEIGVCHGGSLELWRDFFGEGSCINGLDINPKCKEAESEQISVFIGDQADISFLEHVINTVGSLDIIIDDGGHTMNQQTTTFNYLFPKLSNGGLYVCEDLHTSYFSKNYKGGLRRKGTFIEYAKSLVDHIHHHYLKGGQTVIPQFIENISSIHFYDSICIVEKNAFEKPTSITSGQIEVEEMKHVSAIRHPRKWIQSKLRN